MCNCGGTTNNICTNNDCACPIKDFSTDCILYTGEDLSCTGIEQNSILTEVFLQLDDYLCDLSTELRNYIGLVSVGTGKSIYKGVDGIGRKQLRTIDSVGDLVDVELSTNQNTLEVSINENNLISFIQDNQTVTIATNSTTTGLSLATLNSTYPTANIGFRVHCMSIVAGRLIYEKTSTGWVSYSVVEVV
jgi:hypothetical protein